MLVKYAFPFLDPVFKYVFDTGCNERDLSWCDKAVCIIVMKMVSEGKGDIVGGFDTCGSHVFVTLDH